MSIIQSIGSGNSFDGNSFKGNSQSASTNGRTQSIVQNADGTTTVTVNGKEAVVKGHNVATINGEVFVDGKLFTEELKPVAPKAAKPARLPSKYFVSGRPVTPLDMDGDYFILRLDNNTEDDPSHRQASIRAMLAYGAAIAETKSNLAEAIVAFYFVDELKEK